MTVVVNTVYHRVINGGELIIDIGSPIWKARISDIAIVTRTINFYKQQLQEEKSSNYYAAMAGVSGVGHPKEDYIIKKLKTLYNSMGWEYLTAMESLRRRRIKYERGQRST